MRYINRDGGSPSLITGTFSLEQTPGQETIDEASAEYLDWLNKQGDYLPNYVWHRLNGTPKYDSLPEQADMQYRDLVNTTTEWKDHIAAVKAAHPKP